jgi:uncharacterized membrane protein required for colicin V production
MKIVIDLIISGLILLLIYALTSEGLWGSALMFFNVLFSAMVAFNFYEPLATLLDRTGIPWGFSDTLCLMGLFCVTVVAFRLVTESIAPVMVRFPVPIYHFGRLLFGTAGALVTMAVAILAFHTAPINKKIFGVIRYNSKPPFGMGLDHQFLGFFQYETGAVFSRYGVGSRDPHHQYGHGARLNLFDPRAEWLMQHEDARPYGEGSVLSEEGGGGDAAGGGEAAAGAAPGGRAAGGRPGAGAPPP